MRTSILLSLVLVACGGQMPMQMQQQPPPVPQTPQPPAPQYSCLQVLSCIVECPETDEACQNGCLAKGTQVAQTQTVDLAMCLDRSMCEDSDCAVNNCGTELRTCLGASVPPSNATPLMDPPPPGSVPSNLVGSWVGARDGITTKLQMNADGTGTWWSSTATSYYACSNFSRKVRIGTFVVDGSYITMYSTKTEEQIHDCSGPDEVTSLPNQVEKAQYLTSNNPDEILLVDEQCAAQYPEGRNCTMYAGCPIGLYCTARLKRE